MKIKSPHLVLVVLGKHGILIVMESGGVSCEIGAGT
ncbi:MAG: hypothetical protein K0S80_4171 [Neobacillus sp.]|nr:hypothetical protein [Neobacillus sp.]